LFLFAYLLGWQPPVIKIFWDNSTLSKCLGHQNLQLLSSFTITIAHDDTIKRLIQM
jgi:hypothetical protein